METKLGIGGSGRALRVVRGARAHTFCALAMSMSVATLWLLPGIGSAQSGPEAADAGRAEETPIVASAARIDALQALVRGEHPGVSLDSVLGVSLDDDSSMNEHDRVLRLRRRSLLIAVRSAERFKNKSEEEVAHMRDQILAADLERKVLALPIEVRERLVQLDAETDEAGDEETHEPEESVAPSGGDVGETSASNAQVRAPANRGKGRASAPRAQPAPAKPKPAPAPSHDWSLFFAVLIGAWLTAQLFGVLLRRVGPRLAEKGLPLERVSVLGRLVIAFAGVTTAVILAFPVSDEVVIVALGGLVLTLALALKDFAASLWAGLLLSLQRPFAVGDTIEIDGVDGKVLQVGLASVRVLTPHRRVVSIPTQQFFTKRVSYNAPSSVATPLQMDFFIDPNQDIAAAKCILEEAIDNTRCVDTPRPRVILVNQVLTERMVTVRLRTKVFVMGSQPEQEVESELTERVLEGFRTNGVRMPALQTPAA